MQPKHENLMAIDKVYGHVGPDGFSTIAVTGGGKEEREAVQNALDAIERETERIFCPACQTFQKHKLHFGEWSDDQVCVACGYTLDSLGIGP